MTTEPRAVQCDLDELRLGYRPTDDYPMPGDTIDHEGITWRVHTVAWGTGYQTLTATASPA